MRNRANDTDWRAVSARCLKSRRDRSSREVSFDHLRTEMSVVGCLQESRSACATATKKVIARSLVISISHVQLCGQQRMAHLSMTSTTTRTTYKTALIGCAARHHFHCQTRAALAGEFYHFSVTGSSDDQQTKSTFCLLRASSALIYTRASAGAGSRQRIHLKCSNQ